jgi:hypothetical protein
MEMIIFAFFLLFSVIYLLYLLIKYGSKNKLIKYGSKNKYFMKIYEKYSIMLFIALILGIFEAVILLILLPILFDFYIID